MSVSIINKRFSVRFSHERMPDSWTRSIKNASVSGQIGACIQHFEATCMTLASWRDDFVDVSKASLQDR